MKDEEYKALVDKSYKNCFLRGKFKNDIDSSRPFKKTIEWSHRWKGLTQEKRRQLVEIANDTTASVYQFLADHYDADKKAFSISEYDIIQWIKAKYPWIEERNLTELKNAGCILLGAAQPEKLRILIEYYRFDTLIEGKYVSYKELTEMFKKAIQLRKNDYDGFAELFCQLYDYKIIKVINDTVVLEEYEYTLDIDTDVILISY